MIPSLFLPIPSGTADTKGVIRLSPEQSRHVSRVLRLGPGDKVFLLDGIGHRYEGEVLDKGPAIQVRLGAEAPIHTESPIRITLYQGLPKGDKMDLIVQKCTELGVSAIRPVVTERSQVRATERADRWRRIAESAASQAGRCIIPEIHEPGLLEPCLTHHRGAGVVFWEKEEASLTGRLNVIDGKVDVFVGPEGGLTKEEIAKVEAIGFIRATLGPRILRTETAAILAVGIVQFAFGDLGGQA